MVETRGSRRKSVAAAAPLSTTQDGGEPASSRAEDGNAAETISKYRQQFLQRQQEEQRTAWRRLVSRVRLWWYQYEMSYGPYMLDPWERSLVLAFILSVMGFTLYGAYNVGQRYLLQ